MITPQQATGRVITEVGTVVRPHGFRGSRGSWTLINDDGVARISVARSVVRAGVGPGTILAYLSFTVIPLAWWEYLNWRATSWGEPPIPLDASAADHGIGFVETRRTCYYHMAMPDDPWSPSVTTPDEVEKARAVLRAGAATIAPEAIDLLRPGRYGEELSAIPERGPGLLGAAGRPARRARPLTGAGPLHRADARRHRPGATRANHRVRPATRLRPYPSGPERVHRPAR